MHGWALCSSAAPLAPPAAQPPPLPAQPRPAGAPADNACHLSCCVPALKRVPKGDWFCAECCTRQAAEAAAPAKCVAAGARLGPGCGACGVPLAAGWQPRPADQLCSI